MTDFLATLAGVAVVLLFLAGLCRLFKLDEFERLMSVPVGALNDRSRAIYRFLDARIMPFITEFEKMMRTLGFTILRTELSVEGDIARIQFDMSESSLIEKRDGVTYPSDDAEAIESVNRGFVHAEIKKFLGEDPEFGHVGTLNGETDYFTFSLSNPSFGGSVKDLLGEDFFAGYEKLRKDYADLEYILLTGQFPDGLSFGRGF